MGGLPETIKNRTLTHMFDVEKSVAVIKVIFVKIISMHMYIQISGSLFVILLDINA